MKNLRITFIALFAFMAVQVFADNITVSDFEYSTSGTSATVSKYVGSSAEVEIPASVTYEKHYVHGYGCRGLCIQG